MKNPGTAAVLSLLIPGIGQFYNGDFIRGIFWLIITPGLWIGSGGTAGLDLPHHLGHHRPQPGAVLEREAPAGLRRRRDGEAAPEVGAGPPARVS